MPRRRVDQAPPPADTRQRVIDAAVRCILEQGFYRASSNAIAERAGLTWGVIQYHFGSREALMLAVLEEGSQRLVRDLARSEIIGETLVERLEEYFEILAGYYADPEYLAFVQVLLNLSHDPKTSDQARQTIMRINQPVDAEIRRLTTQLFAGSGVRSSALRQLVFYSLRGLALSEVMLHTLPFDYGPVPDFATLRRLLAEALSSRIEQAGESC